MLSSDIKNNLHHYSLEQQQEILRTLCSLKIPEDSTEVFNLELDCEIRIAFQNIMKREDFPSLCSLLEMLCSCLSKAPVKKSVVINMLDNVLECVGITDLKKVLKVIRDQIGNFGILEPMDSNKLLRIINTLLKRISKTEDFHTRGELQMALTKILTLCHDSGFHYRTLPAKTSEINEDKNSFFEDYEDANLTLQFFQEFWELQKYLFMDISALSCSEDASDSNPRLISSRLGRVQNIIEQILTFFKNNKIEHTNTIESFPLKFLKLPNLLSLQLSDAYFRSVIMIQVLIFCKSLRTPMAKTSTARVLAAGLAPGDKQVVNLIEKMVQKELISLELFLKVNDLNEFLNGFFENQLSWIELKDNWKEKKKLLFREPSYQIKEAKRKLYEPEKSPEPAPPQEPSVNAPINLVEKMNKYKLQAMKKIGIQDTRMSSFLANNEPPDLKSEPTLLSFSYHFRQAESCVDSYDFELESQIEFESRSEYNLFEWKALRSLYRENLKDFTVPSQKNFKYKDYRLLNILHKRQNDFYDEPRKRVKPNSENENE